MSASPARTCIFSVDVEDWFHILDLPGAPEVAEWDALPSSVERNFLTLLDLFSRHDARVTCFFLGWVAERLPQLVREAAERGHEIASHGYVHRLAFRMTAEQFQDDAVRSRKLLEDLSGAPVLGYRAAGFSVTAQTPWFFDRVAAAGYRYDASVFPAPRGHGGLRHGRRDPHVIPTRAGDLVEFPVSVRSVSGVPVCFSGGGYLRLFPYAVIKQLTRAVLREGRPVVFYVHPRDIDPQQQRLPMNVRRRFKSYVGLGTTARKLDRLLADFSMTTFKAFMPQVSVRERAGNAADAAVVRLTSPASSLATEERS